MCVASRSLLPRRDDGLAVYADEFLGDPGAVGDAGGAAAATETSALIEGVVAGTSAAIVVEVVAGFATAATGADGCCAAGGGLARGRRESCSAGADRLTSGPVGAR